MFTPDLIIAPNWLEETSRRRVCIRCGRHLGFITTVCVGDELPSEERVVDTTSALID